MNENQFVPLVKDFLKAAEIAVDPTQIEELESLEFEHDDLTCRVYPHSTEDRISVEVGVLRLDLLQAATGFEPLRTLHKLNWAARSTNGYMASISDEDVLIVSKDYDALAIDGTRLAAEMASILDAAANLKSVWQGLIESSVESGPSDQQVSAPIFPGRFA